MSIWADTYKVIHDAGLGGTANWGDGDAMSETSTGSGIFTKTYSNNAAGDAYFRLKINGADTKLGSKTDNGLSDVVLNAQSDQQDGCAYFNLPFATDVTIYYNSSTSKVYVKLETRYTVTINLEASTDRYLYAYSMDNDKYKWRGTYPGSVSGVYPYVYTVNVPKNFPLYLIFNNGNSGSGNQSVIFDLGTITSAISKSISLADDLSYSAMRGTFNSWNTQNCMFSTFTNTAIAKSLSASQDYEFKFSHYYAGSTSDVEENAGCQGDVENGGTVLLYTDNKNSKHLKTGTSGAGDYVFVYKSWSGTTVTLDVYYPGGTYTRTGMDVDKWGTICVPYAVTFANRSGAEFYTIAGKNQAENPTILYLAPVGDADLVAGQPYFFKATGDDDLELTYSTIAAQPGSHNGLIGSYKGCDVAAGLYLLSNNVIVKAGTGCSINENKAYIDMSKVTVGGAGAPGVREIPLAPQGPTDIKSVGANETVVKFIQDGKLFIQKNGIVYDMTGRVVR